MVRTGERCVRVAGGKSSEKKRGTATPSTAAGPSTSCSHAGIGGNPVCPRETPSWQKPITCFFPKIEGHRRQFLEKGIKAKSSKTHVPNRKTVPVVAGPSTEEGQPMSMEEATDAVSPSNRNEADQTRDKKNESLLATPKSNKKLKSSKDNLALSKSGLGNIAASRKRFGHDSGRIVDDNEIPAKKSKLYDAPRVTQPEETAGCSITIISSDSSSATCSDNESDSSSGFEEYLSREHPDSQSDTNDETPKKTLTLENDEVPYQLHELVYVHEDIKSSSSCENWSAVNDSESEDSINRKALRGVNSRGSMGGSITSKISELNSSMLAIHIGGSASVSNEDIIVVSSEEENSDMELENTANFSPESPYMHMNGDRQEDANNAPPQDEVPQGQNNPMELGYPGNNGNNEIPDNVDYPVENGYPEDDGSLAGNNSDDDPPEDTDEEESDTDVEDLDEEEEEEEENDDENGGDDGGAPFYANIQFYHNHIDE